MPRPIAILWQRRGPLAIPAITLAALTLIAADRVTARHVGDRPWIVLPQPTAPAKDEYPGPPWSGAIDEFLFPQVRFHYNPDGSQLGDIVQWIEDHTHHRVTMRANWPALSRVGITRDTPVLFDATDVTLPALLDALCARAGLPGNGHPKMAWLHQPGGPVYLTRAADLAGEPGWRTQRAIAASSTLRRALDRRIPNVRLENLTVGEALRFSAELSGVTIDPAAPDVELRAQTYVAEHNVTFEDLVELIIRQTDGSTPALRVKADGDRLVVFTAAEEP